MGDGTGDGMGDGMGAVTHTLDSLPVGRFHLLHLLRAAFAWCAFSSCQELTPYVFDGLQHEMGITTGAAANFAAAFAVGCTAGAALAVVGDTAGRRRLLLTGPRLGFVCRTPDPTP